MRNNNFGVDTVLNFAGFAAAGVAAYAAFDGKWKITAIAAGTGLLCLYGAVQILKDHLNEKKKEEDFDTIWRENDHIHERINSLENRVDQCVKTSKFDITVDEIHRNHGSDLDAVYRHIDSTNDENMRTLQGEVDGIHRRIDAVDDSIASCETACSGKRGK